MGIDLTPRCAKCGVLMDTNNMKALPDAKGFVCTNCFQRGSGISDIKPSLREPKPLLRVREETNAQKSSISGTNSIRPVENFFASKDYVCDDCNYEFKKSAEFDVKICPFCGKPNVHQKVERPAEAYLADDDE